jgi:hypothetical protein
MTVKDPVTGELRRDMKILHVQFLERVPVQEQERLSKVLHEMFRARGLDKEYLLLVTSPDFKLSVSKVEEFIERLMDEAEVFRKAERLDAIIKSLQDARHHLWNQK